MSSFATPITPWPLKALRFLAFWVLPVVAFTLIGLYLVGPNLDRFRGGSSPATEPPSSYDAERSASIPTSRPTSGDRATASVREITSQVDPNDGMYQPSPRSSSSATEQPRKRHRRRRSAPPKPPQRTETPEAAPVQPSESPDATSNP